MSSKTGESYCAKGVEGLFGMDNVIELYETYKKRKSGTILMTWAQFDELLRHIENTEWHGEDNPVPAYEYQDGKVALHL